MVKTLKPGLKKEKSAEKRKRRENTIKAREQARRFVIPIIVLLFTLLAGFLFFRFGTGTKLTPEEISKLRSQRKLAQMMREKGTDFSKLRDMLASQKVPTEASSDSTFETVKMEDVKAEPEPEATIE